MKKSGTNLKWLAIGLGVVAVFSGGIYALAKLSSSADMASSKGPVTSKIVIEEQNYDFDTVAMKAGKVNHSYKLKNEGEEPVVIEKVYTSCMCTTVNLIGANGKKSGPYGMPGHGVLSKASLEIGPQEEFEVEAIFDPAAHGPSGIGLIQRSIYLETNSAATPKIELRFSADVTN